MNNLLILCFNSDYLLPIFSFLPTISVSTFIEMIFEKTITPNIDGIAYTYSESANRELNSVVALNCFNSNDAFIFKCLKYVSKEGYTKFKQLQLI